MGRDRSAAPRAVPLLRHPRRPRPPRHPVAARPGLRRRGAHQPSTPAPTRGPGSSSQQVAEHVATSPTMRASASASASSTPSSWPATSTATASPPSPIWGDSPRDEREGALRDLADGRRARSSSRSTCSTRASTCPTVDTVLHAAPDREPDALPPAARPWPAQGARTRRSARCSTSSARTARSSASTAASARCSAAPAATSSERSQTAVPVPAGRLPHGARPEGRRDRAAQPPRGHPVAVAGEGRRAAIAAPRRGPTSASPTSSTRPASTSTTSTPARKSWSDLREAAGVPRRCRRARTRATLRRAVGRLLHVDDARADRRPTGGCSPADAARRSRRCRRARAAARCACSSPRSPTRRSPRTTTLQEAVDLALGAPAGASRAARAARRARRAGSTTSTQPLAHASGRAAAGPRSLHPHRDPRRLRPAATGAKIAAWQSGVYEAKAANADLLRLHPRQEQRRLLADDALPRLRHQPRRSSTGRASRSPAPTAPTGLRYRQPRARRPHDPALRPPPRRRPSLLVPRPGDLPRPRRREADGDHLGA